MSGRIPLEVFEELEKGDVELPKVPVYHNQFVELSKCQKSYATFLAEKRKEEKAEKGYLRKQGKEGNVSKRIKNTCSRRSKNDGKCSLDSSKANLSDVSPSGVKLSPETQIRLKEMYDKFEKECEEIDKPFINLDDDPKSNDMVLVDDYDPLVDDINVKVRCRGKILIKEIKRVDKLAEVFAYVAAENNVPAAQVIIYFKNLPVHVNDTPKELGIRLGDILECVIFPSTEHAQENKNCIDIKLQSKDSKVKTVISVHMIDPFSFMMKKYAEIKCLSLDKLVFEFDGDKISPNVTPLDLDMENGSIVDVKLIR